MSKRAEEAALKEYPQELYPHSEHEWIDLNGEHRALYIQGYEQAEKDIWGRIEKYLSRQDLGNYATAGFILKNFEYFKQQIMEEE